MQNLKKIAVDGVLTSYATYSLARRLPNDEKGNPVIASMLFEVSVAAAKVKTNSKRK